MSAKAYSLDTIPITAGMRERARAAKVDPRDDAAVRAHHAKVSRSVAATRPRDEGAVS